LDSLAAISEKEDAAAAAESSFESIPMLPVHCKAGLVSVAAIAFA